MFLGLLGNRQLRAAIQRNLVSFPAQLTPLTKRASGDLQERIVQLYFVHRWSVRNLCLRYSLDKAAVQHQLSEWKRRAIAAGYLQEICPECLEEIAQGEEFADPPGAPGPKDIASSPIDEVLLSALKEECRDRGLELSTAQAEKVRRVLRQIA